MRLFFGCAVLCLMVSTGFSLEPVPPSSVVTPETTTAQPAPGPQVDSANPPAQSMTEDIPVARTDHFTLDPKFKVTKVHIVNNTETYKDGGNHALEFEPKYWNFGAITSEDREARRGQIYVVSWRNSGQPENLRARFEYRQVNTKDLVNVKSLDYASTGGTNRSTFEVVGAEYRKNGPVYAWRFTILRGDQVIALEHSYIW